MNPLKPIKIAILHDYLNQFGGAERVLQTFLEIFPEADIYTLLYHKEKTFGIFDDNIKKTSFLNNKFVQKHHRIFIPFMPLATYALKSKEKYDLVVSSSAGYGKGIRINAPYHISYCHSPLRYAWEIDYLKDLPFSPWPLKEVIIRPIAKLLRSWDKKSSQNVNVFFANSNYIKNKIKSYYGRDSEVIYPPVNNETFYPEKKKVSKSKKYYVMAGRLLYYKRFDLGIIAFNKMKKNLKIVGRGPEFEKLKRIADPRYIEFISNANDDELRKIYSNAEAFIFPQIEDFGLVAAEAQSCGTPVIAFNIGGGAEIVIHKKTGILFDKQTPEAIIDAVRDAEKINWKRGAIARRATLFSKDTFKKNIIEKFHKLGFIV